MSIQAIAWAYAQDCSSPIAKFLLVTLANYTNEHNECWPSKSRLASDMSCSVSSVSKHIAILTRDGLVTTTQRFKDGVQLTTLIRLNCDNRAQGPCGGGGSRLADPPPPCGGNKPSMNRHSKFSEPRGRLSVTGGYTCAMEGSP